MAHRLLIYGVTGYVGGMVARAAYDQGFVPVLAGRDGGATLKVAAEFGFDALSLQLEDTENLTSVLSDMDAVLLTAGPFADTSAPMVEACLRSGTHYVDINAEIDVFEACAALDERAKKAGIMLLSGGGFDVVASDCLAAHVAGQMPNATQLTLGIRGYNRTSRGTRKMMVDAIGDGVAIRQDGRIVNLQRPKHTKLDFGNGPEKAVTFGWGDVATAYHSTGVPNVEVYFSASKHMQGMARRYSRYGWLLRRDFMKDRQMRRAARGRAGPTERQRSKSRMSLWAKAESGQGRVAEAILETPDAYSFTVASSLEIVRRVLNGDVTPGYQTPSTAYGADFIMGFDGVTRKDIAIGHADMKM